MFKTRKSRIITGALATILALAVTGIWLLADTSIASASEMTPEELQTRWIGLEDDLYAPLLLKADWQKGGRPAP